MLLLKPTPLALVSRHPVYDLMRDYLTLSWARFSKDVQSHSLQISKILAHPAPRAGDLIKLDASPKIDGGDSNLEVIARFPGGLDFGRGLVDINFTMWPLFKCLNIDNILSICEVSSSCFLQRGNPLSAFHRLLLLQLEELSSSRGTLRCSEYVFHNFLDVPHADAISRSQFPQSNIWLNSEAGMALPCLLYILEMPRSISMILAHGLWVLLLRLDTASGLRLRSVSVICKL